MDTRAQPATTPTATALLAAVVGSASGPLVVADAYATIIAASPAFEALSGLTEKQTIGRALTSLLIAGQQAVATAAARAVLRGQVWHGDVTVLGRESAVTLHVKLTPVTAEDGRLSYLVVEAEQLAQSRLLSELDPEAQTLGRLSSSIAHDFNNQLSVIINYTHILSRQLPKDSPLQAHVHDMQQTAWRASKLAQQLIVLGRKPLAEPQLLRLDQVVHNLSPLLRTLLGDEVQLRVEVDARLWPVHMALPQAEQVLVNLAVNAREALGGVGEVLVHASNVVLTEDDAARPAGLSAGRYVKLCVRETARFGQSTTVGADRDPMLVTGLGPSLIHRAVHQAGGTLALLQDADASTVFCIHLPALEADTARTS